MIEIAFEDDNKLMVVTLNRPKVNAQNSEFMAQLTQAFTQANQDDNVRGVLLRAEGKCFSAGLDLVEVLSLDEAGQKAFLTAFDEAYSAFYFCEKPIAAAVHGHAIAGGAVLALMADFCALVDGPAQFGTTELAVGVPFPQVAWDAMYTAVPPRTLRKLIYGAALMDFPSAYEMGVGDVLTQNPEEAARGWLTTVSAFPSETFKHTKQQMRQKASRHFDAPNLGEMVRVREIMETPQVKEALANALKR
ncbi:MAG: enoyl-CoA hydratase [Myxococcales bacterium]|nr:enoyl-CoA hydratase [Myxococcales bacterium]|tara:strand:- start:192 stop:935 length:744 start_codon:yes stop_codon:yes gene_type:complete